MDKRIAMSAATLVAAVALLHSISFAQIRRAVPPAPATQPAHDPADIPVKEVVLFSSGVGYFEHAGKVNGDAVTELRFKTDQVNDILKSLLLQDIDGGTIGTVSYPGLAPLAHTLKSFQVDITANPDMSELLNQLRGAKLTVTGDGNQKMTGVILGVEKKLRAVGDKAVVESITLNLKIGHQFQSIPLDQIHSMELEDPTLQAELDEALAALVQARDQDKKAMTLHFNGKGERHVRIGYVVETPIWKTSYRLVLGADTEKKPGIANPPATGPTSAPSDSPTTRPSGLGDGTRHPAKLQGWAIVENQTDNDWNDVELALVSGRPLSFIQDLYHSQYIPRPVIQAENYASLRPQTYTGAMYNVRDLVTNVPDFIDAPDFSLNSTNNNSNQNPQGGGGIGGGGGGGSMFGDTGTKERQAPGQNAQQPPIDPTSSIISAATAAKVGPLFKYSVGAVSLARQTSAMIPIVTDDIEAERVSIYNAAVLATHPLLGARLKNNTKKFLLQGPLTVLDHGSYAGDARIEDLPPGDERLISYGIDQQCAMDSTDTKQSTASVTAKIVKGVMFVTTKNTIEQTYIADNKSEDGRVLVIEHPRQAEFKLVNPPRAEETTPELFRFRRAIQPHKIEKLTIVQEQVINRPVELLLVGPTDAAAFLKDGAFPQNVRDALLKTLQVKQQVWKLEDRLTDLNQQLAGISSDQNRVRENLKAVAAESDYYKRLMKKIDEQESDIEKLQKTIADTHQAHHAAEQALNDYVAGLNVGE